MKIFGYASLLSAEAISEHKLGPEKFKESDLTEAVLRNYKRSFNAFDGHYRYAGVNRKNGSKTNGVIFDLKEKELPRFKKFEGIPDLYDLADVTKDIYPIQNEKVFTLVTRNPSEKGEVPEDYKEQIKTALEKRSKEFQNKFHAETKIP